MATHIAVSDNKYSADFVQTSYHVRIFANPGLPQNNMSVNSATVQLQNITSTEENSSDDDSDETSESSSESDSESENENANGKVSNVVFEKEASKLNNVQSHVDNTSQDSDDDSDDSTSSSSSSSEDSDKDSEEEVDSGVTSDISRHISETDTEYDSFPELRKMNKYQRAATHSRLFKLLQGETGDQTDEEPDDSLKEQKSLEPRLRRDFSVRSDSTRSVDSEAVFGKREQLSLPLLSQYSGSDPDSLSSSSGLASPASPTVNERLLTELIQSLLRGKKGRTLRKLPMEKLRAAALRILQEDMDQYDTVSSSTTDSTPSGTPHDMYGNYYYDYNKYYETWGMVNLDTSIDDYDILPSKAFKGLQERAMGISNNGHIGGTWAKCPRVLSAKNIAQEKIIVKANEEVVCGPDSSDRTTNITSTEENSSDDDSDETSESSSESDSESENENANGKVSNVVFEKEASKLNNVQSHVDNTSQDSDDDSDDSTSSSSSSSEDSDKDSEEEVDSGVTSDISRHISETDTEYDSFPELRKMNKYQRAATHSRLFKLLQGETGDQTDEEPDDSLKEQKSLEPRLRRDFSVRSDSTRSVDSEAVFGKREQLSLPLLSQYSGSDPDSLSSSSGLASPASPTVNERLLTELIQSLLRGKKGRTLRKLPMEKLRAAALRILQEDMDQYDTVSSSTTDSTPSGTPHDMYGNYYYDYNKYYETWGMVNLDTSIDDYDILPSKAFKGLQERAMGISNNGHIGGTWAKCPRVLSAKNIAQEKIIVKANEEVVCGPDSSDRTT
ncbi:uncharacterized protein LOC113376250 [Ctenocephalides felis]|uniref:uncharacterized protein LOC113376250 n=1 Tax=Ctenocephalides felis TaxID=7515 RepID=UPI000E6E1462|nr:uncharacterized protein LOC113376250 [Ctenocephalides felis]